MTRLCPELDSGVTQYRHLNSGPTHRGCRAGRSKQRPIAVVINPRPPPLLRMRSEVCTQNFIAVEINCDIVASKNECHDINVCSLNTRSVKNKTLSIADYITMHDYDIMCVTETWLGRFKDSLSACGLRQHMNEPTYQKGQTLDVVITKDSDNTIDNLEVTDPALCDKSGNISGDYYAISFSAHMSKPHPNRKIVTFRKLRAINVTHLNNASVKTITYLTLRHLSMS